MDEKKEEVRYDLAGGAVLTEIIRELVSQFPGLEQGQRIAFATLGENGGMAMFPGDGAVIEQETRSVTGRVRQVCRYPFAVLVRSAGMTEAGRVSAKELLDDMCRWLQGQPVTVRGQVYCLERYPSLSGGRRLMAFVSLAPAYLYERDEHRTETWAVSLAARYENIFMK